MRYGRENIGKANNLQVSRSDPDQLRFGCQYSDKLLCEKIRPHREDDAYDHGVSDCHSQKSSCIQVVFFAPVLGYQHACRNDGDPVKQRHYKSNLIGKRYSGYRILSQPPEHKRI